MPKRGESLLQSFTTRREAETAMFAFAGQLVGWDMTERYGVFCRALPRDRSTGVMVDGWGLFLKDRQPGDPPDLRVLRHFGIGTRAAS